MKKIIIVLLSFVFGSGLTFSQVGVPKTARQLTAEISATKDAAKKKELLSRLAGLKPHSAADVADLVAASRDTNDWRLKESAGLALQRVGPADNSILGPAYIQALDEKDWRTRISLIVGLGRLKTTEALPKLRSIVKEKPRKDELKMLEANYEEQGKSVWATYSSPAMAARVLGEFKDEESIPLLVSKYNELGEAATESLAMIGKKAIPSLLALAKKEAGKYPNSAGMAFAQISDVAAKDDLLNIFKTEKDPSIRRNAMTSLVNYMQGDDVFNSVKEIYKKEKDSSLLFGLKTKNGIPFLIDVLKTDTDYTSREAAILMLGRIGDKSAVPALEDVLHDKDKNIRARSADALKKLTGKKYYWGE